VSLLLDTNVLSELGKGPRANVHLRGWFGGVSADEVYLSVLVIGELRRGVELVRRRDARQAAALERWLKRVSGDHAERILAVDGEVADKWGRPLGVLLKAKDAGLLPAVAPACWDR